MFRKIHLRLTLLCAGITISVMVVMSCAYLYVSENNLKKNSFSSFQSDMNTLLSNLESQTVITHEWLSKIEGNGKYLINLKDNGVDFLWGNFKFDPQRQALLETARNYYSSHFAASSALSPFYTFHTEFEFTSPGADGTAYYGCAAYSYRSTGTLEIMILQPLTPLTEQILDQRLTFALIVLVSSVFLSVFAYYFTGKLLLPIERSRQAQIQFVAAASHELRTPLSVILSAASACRRADSAEQDRFFDTIHEEGQTMSRLISDLLTLANGDSQTFSVRLGSCEADTLLLNTYEAFATLAREKGYRLTAELPDRKIEPVQCDAERIRQVLSILLHNAFSHTPPGTHIHLSLSDGPHALALSVSDNGPGIDDADKPHIFDRFYRADTARHGGANFGLGLSIARQIMNAHHGAIEVCDAPGGGAAFTLTLPR